MGCDIHAWVEIKQGDNWVAIKELDIDRYYKRFSALADGVRGSGDNPPLGLPINMSDTVKYWSNYWGSDGHSHSYMEIGKAAKIFLETEHEPSDYMIKYPESAFFDLDEPHNKLEARLIFWFDN